MPLYEYIATDPDSGCRICGKGFELQRPLDRPALEACPICKEPVKKLVSRGVTSARVSKPASVSEAKSAGFTVLERRDEGVYEKL